MNGKGMLQSHFLIGAATSGSGKTTLTLGLLRALARRGKSVQSFKCGPDYIDTWHHRMATGKLSVNLDSFMMSESHIRTVYRRYASRSDIAVTEGVMGLFDGYSGMRGSSAEIADWLHIPVLLVINARSTAYSVAPLLYGFKHFHPQLNIVGAVFNFVSSESHYAFLKQACADAGVEPLGYLPKADAISIPSRHLGLSIDPDSGFDQLADRIADWVEGAVDINRLLELTSVSLPEIPADNPGEQRKMRIAVAHDEAFNFCYAENITLLRQWGRVTFFSPLHDAVLPEADFVYFPGGYPELYAQELADNSSMRISVHEYVEQGGRMLAECGGMMYLCRSLTDKEGVAYPMVGILPQEATMENMKLRLGYRLLRVGNYRLLGHEFHYSSVKHADASLTSCAEARNARDTKADVPLYHYKNLLAGYTHLYWADPASNTWFLDFLSGKW